MFEHASIIVYLGLIALATPALFLGVLGAASLMNRPLSEEATGKACQAAFRLFRTFNFVGLTRERVLAILGDPKTISDYGIAAAPTPDSPLTYRFDSGLGGWDYVIEFRRGIVTTVKKNGLN